MIAIVTQGGDKPGTAYLHADHLGTSLAPFLDMATQISAPQPASNAALSSEKDTNSKVETAAGVPAPSSAPFALEVLAGMAAGAATGAIAGPPGMIAGALIGSAVGAAASIALDAQDTEESRTNEELDREIGVIDGSLGAAPPNQPPAVRGTFSVAAMGLSNEAEVPPTEGPIPNVDES